MTNAATSGEKSKVMSSLAKTRAPFNASVNSAQLASPPAHGSNADEISPELAAMIVKNYILPMFENKHKRELRTKYNKMAGIRAATGRNVKGFAVPE